MPKEYIRNIDSNSHKLVEVSWGLNNVQIASINLDLDKFEGNGQGWYIDLDREQINKMIKVLRKARDQAHGRDE